ARAKAGNMAKDELLIGQSRRGPGSAERRCDSTRRGILPAPRRILAGYRVWRNAQGRKELRLLLGGQFLQESPSTETLAPAIMRRQGRGQLGDNLDAISVTVENHRHYHRVARPTATEPPHPPRAAGGHRGPSPASGHRRQHRLHTASVRREPVWLWARVQHGARHGSALDDIHDRFDPADLLNRVDEYSDCRSRRRFYLN